ncbi:zinc-dependent alcohol dehydrogenase family protein [Streptomyces sp. NBC_00257]|uniref:zinc-dependent alcohol dehydrogenase family protein n=1 Tax=unclassified Streptomyces TaxID=2593676 RepID=UPI0022562B71|nr:MULTISPECIES: zinc-dependent alcohol dehydrogenase family protein [unclassified Streptomyces]WTB58848.1 zinc-dependent alcohol dehydrogenase family protein [Streptomyces sp. NBC_00826]WTH88275.1 zinc-dependent alcohol dehydrogenase family protein [Streptomyces sp. NBC_00825]WTH97003.1 zinc-dependent alcohol dehydrogenase family protein [Streptomyces sp. NBC_00822]MCX4862491.1 zinc-dependent alcohol dehydrogenase family protein [Streptomyces sp. NBC_00906]MCX4893728.1 zinc-dependent alcohol 
MKALVFQGPGQIAWQDVPDPVVKDAADAVIRVDVVTICGTDLHIIKGDVPEVAPGRVLGHEAVGTVVEAGAGVRTVRPGDRVLISCISACGRCRFCREGHYGQCRGGGGWVLGHTIDGTQAEYVRVPFADLSVHPLPASVGSHDGVLLADIFPTAYEVGVLNGGVRPGDTVVVVGAGPIGLAAIVGAGLYSPRRIIAVDLAESRLAAARSLGADATAGAAEEPGQLVDDLTEGLGADVAIEAVGVPEAFEMCTRMVRPGGRVANIGVHGRPATLHLEDLWSRDITITTGLVDTYSTPMLLGMLAAGRLPSSSLITHRFELGQMEEAYDVFSRAADTGALKVTLGGPQHNEIIAPAQP